LIFKVKINYKILIKLGRKRKVIKNIKKSIKILFSLLITL